MNYDEKMKIERRRKRSWMPYSRGTTWSPQTKNRQEGEESD